MRPTMLQTLLTLIGVAALAVPAWIVSQKSTFAPQSPRPKSYTGPEVAALQALAENSCRCARAKQGRQARDACWEKFNAATGRRDEDDVATYCDPVSPRLFDLTGHRRFIVTAYDFAGGDKDLYLCSPAEAGEIEALFANEYALYERSHGRKGDPAGALRRRAEEFVRGRLPAKRHSDGCS